MSKRIIRVGLLDPTIFEDHTIYVCVRRETMPGRYEGTIQATALSLKPFQYGEDEIDKINVAFPSHGSKEPVYKVTTEIKAEPLIDGDYKVFTSLLSEKNDGVISERFVEDGIEMYGKLEAISRLAS